MADGDGTQSGAEGTQSGTGETTTDSSTTSATETGTQGGTETTTTTPDPAAQAKAEAESFRTRMQAADQRAARFEQELKQLKDKDLPEAEKLKRDFQAAQDQVVTLQKTNQDLTVRLAFLEDNTYSWHDAKAAMKLVDLDQIQIDGDNKVSGMKDALKALATSHPYLIKQDVKPEATPPGTAPGNNGANGTGKPKSGDLVSRFPIMRTRVQR
jgi:hypothetical protein